MASWPTSPDCPDLYLLNGGQRYTDGSAVIADTFNQIVTTLIALAPSTLPSGWQNPANINNGNLYSADDVVTASDMNKIIADLVCLDDGYTSATPSETATWPISPVWHDPSLLPQYSDADGIVIDVINAIVEDLMYICAEPVVPATPADSILFYSEDAFSISLYTPEKRWDGALYYSTDHFSWTEWDGASAISAVSSDGWYRIYMRGVNNTYITGPYVTGSGSLHRWNLTGDEIFCIGNAETLLDYQTVLLGNHPVMYNHCYTFMFYGCTSLVSAPELPATTLAEYCYSCMFEGCTSLATAPALPATTLARGCYVDMFYECASLVNAPALPATTLATNCYFYMFYKCTSLVNAPSLPATTLAEGCYRMMFSGCTSITDAPELPATTLAEDCYLGMLQKTSITDAPALPATTLASGCYCAMFLGCASLVNAPELPATTLAYQSYRSMFSECTSLVTAPNLPATTLSRKCYYSMFQRCTSLVNAPVLPATTLAGECYYDMFAHCTSLQIPPALPATTDDASECYSMMFFLCTSLIALPELPILVLYNTYRSMFSGCTSIKLSTTRTGEYQTPYRIPSSGTGRDATAQRESLNNMFKDTGGTFKGTPTINTTYYTSNTVVPAT